MLGPSFVLMVSLACLAPVIAIHTNFTSSQVTGVCAGSTYLGVCDTWAGYADDYWRCKRVMCATTERVLNNDYKGVKINFGSLDGYSCGGNKVCKNQQCINSAPGQQPTSLGSPKITCHSDDPRP